MNNRVGSVDYESIVKTPEGVTPNIDTTVFECGDGCHPDFTNECEAEYSNDNPQPNPFVAKFECKNINFTYAIMDEYKKCYTYPVFAALFYDYDAYLHQVAIVQQLNPHTNAIGNAILKFLQTLFIIVLIKVYVFPFYFKLEQEIASSCCDAIRLKRVVQVEVAQQITTKQMKKMAQENIMHSEILVINEKEHNDQSVPIHNIESNQQNHDQVVTNC